jgi:hypothetical protein
MNAKTLTQSLIAGVFAVSAGLGFAADAAKPEAKPAAAPAPTCRACSVPCVTYTTMPCASRASVTSPPAARTARATSSQRNPEHARSRDHIHLQIR